MLSVITFPKEVLCIYSISFPALPFIDIADKICLGWVGRIQVDVITDVRPSQNRPWSSVSTLFVFVRIQCPESITILLTQFARFVI